MSTEQASVIETQKLKPVMMNVMDALLMQRCTLERDVVYHVYDVLTMITSICTFLSHIKAFLE